MYGSLHFDEMQFTDWRIHKMADNDLIFYGPPGTLYTKYTETTQTMTSSACVQLFW